MSKGEVTNPLTLWWPVGGTVWERRATYRLSKRETIERERYMTEISIRIYLALYNSYLKIVSLVRCRGTHRTFNGKACLDCGEDLTDGYFPV